MLAIVPWLAAALNRSTLLTDPNQPDGENPATYYTAPVTNHYARIVHAASLDGRGYAFPYDDVAPTGGADQSGSVNRCGGPAPGQGPRRSPHRDAPLRMDTPPATAAHPRGHAPLPGSRVRLLQVTPLSACPLLASQSPPGPPSTQGDRLWSH